MSVSATPPPYTHPTPIFIGEWWGGAWKFGEVTMTMANESVGIRRYVAGFDM